MSERSSAGPIMMAAATDVGTVRKQNEDYHYYSEDGKFFIVCDGMGGHQAGALASKIAVETVRDALQDESTVDFEKLCEDIDDQLPLPALKLIAGVRLANRRIIQEASRNEAYRGMGSTIVVAMVYDKWLFTINVGDSRIYRLRNGVLSTLTHDHTWLNELIEDKEISEKDALKFSKKNVLTRALGIYPTVKIDLRIDNLEQDDIYLLCSDGLHNALSDELIQSILSADHKTPGKMADKVVLSAKQLNGSDNITGGILQINHLHKAAASPTSFEKTIMDETQRVTFDLDKTLKLLYPAPKATFESSTKWMALGGVGVVLIVLMGFLLNRSGATQSAAPQALASTALLTQEISTIGHISSKNKSDRAEQAGALILLQVKDDKYINLLRSLGDMRILDHVKNFGQNLPVYAGEFTWAVADSSQKIIYQKNGVRLTGKNEWPATASRPRLVEPTRLAGTARNNASQAGALTTENGTVYIIGSFENTNYRDAEIFVENTRVGALRSYLESGFTLRPGNYTISIRDTAGNVLKSRPNQFVGGGEIVAVEF